MKNPSKKESSSSLCPLCSQSYDPISRRPISEDSCGHTMCLQCFIFKNNQNGCIQCKNLQKENIAPSANSSNDGFDDFDHNQLFDDWDRDESVTQNDSKQNDMDFTNSIYDEDTEDEESEDESDTNTQPYKVQWLSNIKDDAAEFSRDHTYPHTKDMLGVFDSVFGLKQVKLIDYEVHFIDYQKFFF